MPGWSPILPRHRPLSPQTVSSFQFFLAYVQSHCWQRVCPAGTPLTLPAPAFAAALFGRPACKFIRVKTLAPAAWLGRAPCTLKYPSFTRGDRTCHNCSHPKAIAHAVHCVVLVQPVCRLSQTLLMCARYLHQQPSFLVKRVCF